MRQHSATLLFSLAMLCMLVACSAKNPAYMPDSALRIGVVPFSQPSNIAELLAGYVSDSTPKIDTKVFPLLDNDFADLLAEMTTRDYIGLDKARTCMQKHPKAANSPALAYWIEIGKCMDAELLLVPQIHNWQERQGGEMGVANSASVSIDIFLIDIKNGEFLLRSRYDEKQRALLENIMDLGKFVERKGRWVSAATLAKEGMFKAIKDFGL